MKIRILGTRGEIEPSAPYHARHSGVLVDGKILLDLGEREFLDRKPQAAFITHLHPDHAIFVRDRSVRADLPVYAPEARADGVRVRVVARPMTLGPYRITPIPTVHSKNVKSSAYLVRRGKRSLLYTGDLIWIPRRHRRLLGRPDLVITEASFLREGGAVRRDAETGQVVGHTGVPNLVHFFRGFTRHILLVHFGAWFYADMKTARRQLRALGRQHGVEVHVGYDGMEMSLGQLD
jgi:ribonuclease BN (tRNA processing enzyme)